MRRVPPSTLVREEIAELITAGIDRETNILSALAELGVRYVTQQALEQEQHDHLGRGHYERRGDGTPRGYRNGYEAARLRTAEGEVTVRVPQVRDAGVSCRSSFLSPPRLDRCRTSGVESLPPRTYVRIGEVSGGAAAMSKRYDEEVKVQVEQDGGLPAVFTWRGRRYEVADVIGHWRIEGRWWADGRDREYWRIEARGGAVWDLYHDRLAGRWHLERLWD
jgi:hypothetical protein